MVDEELIIAIGRLERAISRSENALGRISKSVSSQQYGGENLKLKLAITDAIQVIDELLEGPE